MGEIEATIKELRGKIEDLKKRSETQKHLENIRERIEKLENEPERRKGLDSCFDIEKEEVLWPSFEGLFED
ncbi:hypothetical protein ES703_60039 [subsurface metagenome]|jgi:ribosome-interacting GTPase 1